MERNVLSSGIHHPSIPRSYSRPESELPRPSQVSDSEIVPVVPVIDSSSHGKPLNVQQVGQTSKSYSFFQVMDHGANSEAMKKISEVENEFFSLPVEEMTKPYSEDPSNTVRLSTSFNVNTEKVHKWRDYLRLHSSTPNWHALFAFQIPVIGMIVQMHFYNSSPLDEHLASIWIFIMCVLIYCFAFGYHTDILCYAKIALISGSLAYAALISVLVPHFLKPFVFIVWLMLLITYFIRTKIAKMGENMASTLCELWTRIKGKASYLHDQWRTKRTNAPATSRPPV